MRCKTIGAMRGLVPVALVLSLFVWAAAEDFSLPALRNTISDPGTPDSVIIDLAGAVRFGNDSLWVAMLVRNDEEIMTGVIPIFYESPDDYWIVDTALFTSDRWTYPGPVYPPENCGLEDRFSEDPDTTKYMIWWLGIFNNLQLGRDTVVILHFVKNPLATTPTGFFTMGFTMVEEQMVLTFVDPVGNDWAPVMAMTKEGGGYGAAPDSIPTGFFLCDCSYAGDCNDDGSINPLDVVFLINYALCMTGPAPPTDSDCPLINRGDWDCSGRIDVADIVKMVRYVYRFPAPGPCDPCPD